MAIGLIYLLLIAGGVTMVYPFLITLTSAVSNGYDYERFSAYPRYLFDGRERYLKYLAEKYSEQEGRTFRHFLAAYGLPEHFGSFREIAMEDEAAATWFGLYGAQEDSRLWRQVLRRAEDLESFVAKMSSTRRGAENLVPLFQVDSEVTYQQFTRARYRQIAAAANSETFAAADDEERDRLALAALIEYRSETYPAFDYMRNDVGFHFPVALPRWILPYRVQFVDYNDWVRTLAPAQKMPVTRQYLWSTYLFEVGLSPTQYNEMAGTRCDSIWQVPYPVDEPEHHQLAALRRAFDLTKWPVRLSKLTDLDRDPFDDFLIDRFGSVEALNTVYGTSFASFGVIPLEAELPVLDIRYEVSADVPELMKRIKARRDVWRDYMLTRPPELRQQLVAEEEFGRFLLTRYKNLDELLQIYGVSDLAQIKLPIAELDYVHYQRGAGNFFGKYLSRNFSRALFHITVRGRALWNTLVLVVLTIAFTLTVNPLAAYALSRFRLRGTNKILVFLLATMAFPPAVSMIPAFLLMRDLNLLNTFFALVLPGAANGFWIFLLKGLFDSLPKELYEAASLDGASEARMFCTITVPLSKPILAVITLGAFMSAYGGFMWAFLVCQDERMWTLMVWLYQFQQMYRGQPWIVMAALVIASIPTLIIFLTCQKVILRGIIIPTMD